MRMGGVECRMCGAPCDGIVERGEDNNLLCCRENDYEYEHMCDVCKDAEYSDFKMEYIVDTPTGPYCKKCNSFIPHIEDTHIAKHLEETAE